MKLNTLVSMIAVAGLAATASAQVKNYDSGAIELPVMDSTSVSNTIDVADAGTILDFEEVWLNIDHTFVGDLTFTLSHGATSCVILDRPGVPAFTFGNGDDLAGLYTFVDGGPAFPEDPGTSGIVDPGIYASAGDLGACFNGTDKFGPWIMTVTDSAGGDVGVLHSWGFSVRNVPTPGAAAVLGLGGLFAARRRRSN